MKYTCPLCRQPVSGSLYQKITGIWEEKQKALARIREQRARLLKRFRERERRLKQQTSQFRKKSARLIREAVAKRTKPLESQITAFRRKEREIERNTRRKVNRAAAEAHRHADRRWSRRLNSLRKELQASIRDRVRKEKERTTDRIERRYRKLRNSFSTTLEQMQVKDRRLQRQARQIKEIERNMREKIQGAAALANRHAERRWSSRVSSLRRELQGSMRVRVRKERARTAERVERRYRKLRNSFQTTLQQMQVKENRLQEQARQIRELQRQLRRETTPQSEGLLEEGRLLRELRKRFPDDRFKHEGKGGDVLHWPIRNNHVAGLIVYECKRAQRYLPAYVKQAADAKEKRKADFAILVTSVMKKRTHGFFAEKGVLVVHPAGVVPLVNILRDQIIHIAEMKLGQLQRNKAVKLTLEYLEGPEFANSMDGIMQQALTLYEDLKHEVKNHVAVWRKRIAGYGKVYEDASTVKSTTRALLSGEPEYKSLIKTESLPPILELPELEKYVASSESAEKAEARERAAKQTGFLTEHDRKTSPE